jgi:hypothetical protein
MRPMHAFESGVGATLTSGIVAFICVVLPGGALAAYTARAHRRNRSARARSETEVDYEARDDLTPTLEETLRRYTFPPEGALRAVTTAPAPGLSRDHLRRY